MPGPSHVLHVGCSQGPSYPGCKKFRDKFGLSGVPYTLLMPSGAKNTARLRYTLRLIRDDIGADLGLVQFALHEDRYVENLTNAITTLYEFYPKAAVSAIPIPVARNRRPDEIDLVVRCMDYRLEAVCEEVLKMHDLVEGNFDISSCPGGGGELNWLEEDLKRYKRKGIRVRRVILKTHDNCGAGKTADDLPEAARLVKKHFPNAEVFGFHLCQNGSIWVPQPVSLAA